MNHQSPHRWTGWPRVGIGAVLVLNGAVLTFFSFIGFEDMLNVTEEVKDPRRNLPRALLIGWDRVGVADAGDAIFEAIARGRDRILLVGDETVIREGLAGSGLSDEQKAGILDNVQRYVELKERYRSGEFDVGR